MSIDTQPDTSSPGLIGLKTSCWCDLLISLAADAANSQTEVSEIARYTRSGKTLLNLDMMSQALLLPQQSCGVSKDDDRVSILRC